MNSDHSDRGGRLMASRRRDLSATPSAVLLQDLHAIARVKGDPRHG